MLRKISNRIDGSVIWQDGDVNPAEAGTQDRSFHCVQPTITIVIEPLEYRAARKRICWRAFLCTHCELGREDWQAKAGG